MRLKIEITLAKKHIYKSLFAHTLIQLINNWIKQQKQTLFIKHLNCGTLNINTFSNTTFLIKQSSSVDGSFYVVLPPLAPLLHGNDFVRSYIIPGTLLHSSKKK